MCCSTAVEGFSPKIQGEFGEAYWKYPPSSHALRREEHQQAGMVRSLQLDAPSKTGYSTCLPEPFSKHNLLRVRRHHSIAGGLMAASRVRGPPIGVRAYWSSGIGSPRSRQPVLPNLPRWRSSSVQRNRPLRAN